MARNKRFGRIACGLFEHDFDIISATSLETYIKCERCGTTLRYEFEVEDDFFAKHFPEHYGPVDGGEIAK